MTPVYDDPAAFVEQAKRLLAQALLEARDDAADPDRYAAINRMAGTGLLTGFAVTAQFPADLASVEVQIDGVIDGEPRIPVARYRALRLPDVPPERT